MLLAACPPPKIHDTMLEFRNTSAKRVKQVMVIKVTYLIRVGTRVISVIRVARKLNAERGTLVGRGRACIPKRSMCVLTSPEQQLASWEHSPVTPAPSPHRNATL